MASDASTSRQDRVEVGEHRRRDAFRFSARFSVTVATGPSTASRTRSLIGRRPRARDRSARAGTARIHLAQVRADPEIERRLADDVPRDADPGGDLGHGQAVGQEPDHAALGHEDDLLSALERAPAAEGDVLDLRHEARVLALLHDHDVAVIDRDPGAGGEVAGEDEVLRAGGDVDEATDPGRHVRARREARDVHVAVRVDLEERQHRPVEAAALEVLELVRRRHEGVGVLRTAEREPEERDAADGALLDHPGHRAVEPFLEQDPGHERGDPEAEVHRLAVPQLQRGPPGDHLLRAPFGELEVGGRRPVVARRLRQESRSGSSGADPDATTTASTTMPGTRTACAGSVRPSAQPLHLGDDDAAVVVRGERLVEHAERRALVLGREVAELVGSRRADDRHVDRDGPQVEPLAPVELDDRDDVLGRPGVHAAAVAARVHERVHAHLGQDARLADRRGAVELEQDPDWDVVGLDLVGLDGADDLRRRRR